MVFILVTVVSIAIGGVLVFGGHFVVQRQLATSISSERDALIGQVESAEKEVVELIKYSPSYASRGQFDTVEGLLAKVKADIESERSALSGIEQKLESAQKSVEEKESLQQDLKSSKEEDENKLQTLLESYENISTESITLEQQLAASMKNLDSIIADLEITLEQKAVLEDLSRTLTSTSGTLRDLLVEYESLNERLNLLKQQHQDLEEEYVRLVEKQLGE